MQHLAGGGSGGSSSWGAVADVAALLFQNSLVWSTGASLLLSSLGSSLLLDPAQPSALKHLAFVEQLLGWFAQTTAPLTLFTTGLWMHGNSGGLQQQQQQRGVGRHERVPIAEAAVAVTALQEAVGPLGLRQLCVYLLLRCTLAPAMMVLLCWLFGVTGDLAHALVILALLPVAQTAFVVCKAANTGMHAVSVVMVASLLVMLPQLMLVLACMEWLGVLSAST